MKLPRESLRRIVEDTDTPAGRVFTVATQALIVVSLVSFSIETLPTLHPNLRSALRSLELIVVAIFTVEYLIRLYASTPPTRYLFSFFGMVDLLAILPYLAGLGVDLRSARIFRLFRLLRVFKLVRYSAALRRFQIALGLAREEIVLFLAATVVLLWLSACGIYLFESQAQPESFGSVFASLWWAVATLTTVGYGDVYPITTGGRLFTFMVLLVGLGVISVPAGLVASALSEARELEERTERDQ